MRLVDAGVTVKDRILLHLLDHWGQPQRGEWPETQTQEGIASVVGISRSHVAVTLPDLIGEQMVEVRTERVRGRSRKVKVYALTYQGGMRAGALAQRLLRCELTAVDDGSEFDLPLDGLIQVYRVHMLVALRLLDEDNRLDLDTARGLVEGRVRPPVELTAEEAVAEEIAASEGIGEVAPEEPVGPMADSRVPEATAAEPQEVLMATPERAPQEVATPPPLAREPPPAPVQETTPAIAPVAPRPAPGATGPPPAEPTPRHQGQGGGHHPQAWHAQQRWAPPPHLQRQAYPHQPYAPMYFWSPLRFGSGRRPDTAMVGSSLALGWLLLLGAIVLMGIDPVFCAVVWVPLTAFGLFLAWYGLRSTWAMRERRDAWVAAALSAFAFLVATVMAYTVHGGAVVLDLGWAGLMLGIPSLALASGTGRSVERRGGFALVVGPVLVSAGMAMTVLDPEGLGETGAFPLLLMAGGASWTFVGWVMVRRLEAGLITSRVLAGAAIGLAVTAVGGAAHLASTGDLTEWMAVGIALWVGLAAYVATVQLVPGLEHRRPDLRSTYGAIAVVGASALLTAAAIFFIGGLPLVGVLEAVIAVSLVVLVVPDMRKGGATVLPVTVLGVLASVASVLAALGGP